MRDFIEVTLEKGRTLLFVDKLELVCDCAGKTNICYGWEIIRPKESIEELKAKLGGLPIGKKPDYFPGCESMRKMFVDIDDKSFFGGVVSESVVRLLCEMSESAGATVTMLEKVVLVRLLHGVFIRFVEEV